MKRQVIHLGRKVICDMCGKDWTDSPDIGGMLFDSKACCPECSKEMEISVKRHKEERFIKGRCPDDMSFADWVRDVLREDRPLGGSIIKEREAWNNIY